MLGNAFWYYKNKTFLALSYFKIQWENHKQILKKCTQRIEQMGLNPFLRNPKRTIPLDVFRFKALRGQQNLPKTSPRGPKRAPRRPKAFPKSPETAQEASGRPPRGTNTIP